MTSNQKKMSLAVIPNGAGYAWRYGDGKATEKLDFNFYKQAAQAAERGLFDIVFIADSYGIREDRVGLSALKGLSHVLSFEAFTLISALAAVTEKIGLVATASTSYNEPYHIARKLASVDHLSKGRAGWNIVTSTIDAEAYNFGLDDPYSNTVRYERAEECLEAAEKLWDSWEDDAVVCDRATNVYFDDAKVHRVNHRGKHFKVRGPLNLSRPPQGYPLICQAGASESGWNFAARKADVMYGKAIALSEAQRFYAEVKGRMAKYGRQPSQLKILPGLMAVVGKTEKEAREKFRAVQDCLTEPEGRGLLVHLLPGIDLSGVGMDEPIPDTPEIEQATKRFRIFLSRDGRRLTVREAIDYVSAAIGHLALIGSASQVADEMVRWVNENGADGFNLMPQTVPGGLEDFVNFVVPELQERGAFRTAYEGDTLRERMGLARPANQHLPTTMEAA